LGVDNRNRLIIDQPIPAFDQFHKPPSKPSCGGAINHIVVERHRQVEDLARLDPALYYGWLPGCTPHHQAERIW
jgi:hypothetical protein